MSEHRLRSPSVGADFSHERVELFHDERTGLRGAIAVHSTVLGPAMGGLRIAPYDTFEELLVDALRLSRAMTLKNAAAGLALGGGKAVLLDDGRWGHLRAARLRAFSERLQRMDGQYITAEDVGTTPADMQLVAEGTRWVAGRPSAVGGAGDPSPATAHTVFGAIRAAATVRLGRGDLVGVRVGILGLGAVGGRLAQLLHDAEAELVVADVRLDRATAAADRFGATVVSPGDLLTTELEVFAPCALGGVLTLEAAGALRAKVVAGAANNPLDSAEVADALHARGILYVPDFLANCGGIIHVAAEVLGYGEREIEDRIARVIDQTAEVLHRAVSAGVRPLPLAVAVANQRLERGELQVAA